MMTTMQRFSRRLGRRYILLSLLIGSLIVGSAMVRAASLDESANYAFGVYNGSGFYTATSSNATVLLLNFPYSWPVSDEGSPWHWRLAVATGFFDYDGDDVADFELPSSLDTLTIVPGIEYHFQMSDTWVLRPFFDLGYAGNLSTGEEAIVAGVGVVSEKHWGGTGVPHVWFNKLIYSEYETRKSGFHDEYAEILTGIDYRFDHCLIVAGVQVVPTLYSMLFYRYNDIDVLERLDNGYRDEFTIEVGATLYAPKPMDLSVIELNRVGIGYQEAPYGHLVRIVFGALY